MIHDNFFNSLSCHERLRFGANAGKKLEDVSYHSQVPLGYLPLSSGWEPSRRIGTRTG
jgi:hypothetical protein